MSPGDPVSTKMVQVEGWDRPRRLQLMENGQFRLELEPWSISNSPRRREVEKTLDGKGLFGEYWNGDGIVFLVFTVPGDDLIARVGELLDLRIVELVVEEPAT